MRGKNRVSVESPKDSASLTTRLSSAAHAFLATRSWDQRAGASTDRAFAVANTIFRFFPWRKISWRWRELQQFRQCMKDRNKFQGARELKSPEPPRTQAMIVQDRDVAEPYGHRCHP